MRSRRSAVLLPLLALLLATAPAASARDLLARASATGARAAALAAHPRTALLTVDRDALDALRAAETGSVSLPLADGSALDLSLERMDVFAPGATVTWTDAAGPHTFTPDLAVFRGTAPAEPGTWAVVTLSPEGARATVVRGDERLQLMPAEPAAAGALPLHALATESELNAQGGTWACGVDGETEALLEQAGGHVRSAAPLESQLDATRKVFSVAVDCDSELTAKFFGNVTNASAYVTTLLATVSLIYERDLDVTLNVSYLNFWTGTDPYTGLNTSTQLPEFRSWWNSNRSGVSRSIAHLLSGRSLGGGIAYVNVLCANTNSGSGYAVSAIDAAYSYPTNTSTWDAIVVAHEIGHNFGSYHTHSCNWAALGYISPSTALLDSCQAGEGGCYNGANFVPVSKGTIMSYCHQLTGGTANIRMDFHPICITHMRSKVDAAACATSPAIAPPRATYAVATPTGVHVGWKPGGATGVLGYVVYRSRTQFDLAPEIAAVTSDTTADFAGIGTFHYKVRAYRSADTSGFGGEAKLNLCNFGVSANLTVGSAPVSVATGDFNGDGIADLAAVNQNDGTLTLRFGNGAAGVGNGTFSAATTVFVSLLAQFVTATDTNGDGILDLVVGNSMDSSLYVHRGGGAGGLGDGTFDAGTRVPLGFVPSALAEADFDEDGVPDLAVAGHPSALALLFGHGTGGVPDGTWGDPVLIEVGVSPRGVTVGDFDENGIWDVAFTTGNQLKVMRGLGTNGRGDGTFAAPTTSNTGPTSQDVVTGDFNVDGITDLLVANTGAASASLYLGNGAAGVGNGTFPASGVLVTVGQQPRNPSVADWNGDGVPDFAVANNTSAKTASVVTGKGNGTFNPALTWIAALNPWALAIGDWNHDGGVDLAVASRGNNSLTPMLAGCANAQSLALAVTGPAAGDSLVPTTNRVLSWTKGAGVMQVDVQLSRDGGATWATLARNVSETSFTWTVGGPATTHARLRVVDTARGWVRGQSAADFTILPTSVLGAGGVPARFALLGAWPNPARGAFSVSLALPRGGRGARLDLLDLAGRRVGGVPLDGFGPGVHVVPLAGARLRPGVYLARLVGEGMAFTRKVTVLE